MKIFMPVSELIVGTIGITFIALATYHSIKENKADKVKVKAS